MEADLYRVYEALNSGSVGETSSVSFVTIPGRPRDLLCDHGGALLNTPGERAVPSGMKMKGE